VTIFHTRDSLTAPRDKLTIEEKYLFCKTPKIKNLLSMKLGKIGQEI
jgi:hypothetical protein